MLKAWLASVRSVRKASPPRSHPSIARIPRITGGQSAEAGARTPSWFQEQAKNKRKGRIRVGSAPRL